MTSSLHHLVRKALLGSCLALVALAANAEQPPPQNVVQLSASAAVDVVQDILVIQLSAVREGNDASQVQTQIKQLLDAALADAKRSAQPGLLDVRTGNFSLGPRYGRDGRISAWQGT